MKPIIGIMTWLQKYKDVTNQEINLTFATCVEEGGGIPLILPLLNNPAVLSDYLDLVDGLILIGGEDLSPLYYGEDPIMSLPVGIRRDRTEMKVMREVQKRGIPTLGVCRGHQVGAVAYGASLYQDLPQQFNDNIAHAPNRERGFWENYHRIQIEAGSKMHELFGPQLSVNSFHHQAIKDPGDQLKVTARSADGIIEAVESTDGHFIGVQFHPEFPDHNRKFQWLFDALVDEAKKRKLD